MRIEADRDMWKEKGEAFIQQWIDCVSKNCFTYHQKSYFKNRQIKKEQKEIPLRKGITGEFLLRKI